MNKHKSNKIKENSNTVRHLIMGQITTTQNLVAIKEVRHAGQKTHSQHTNPTARRSSILSVRTCYHALSSKRNDRHFADDILKCVLMNITDFLLIKILIKFVPGSSLVEVMGCRQFGVNPLPQPMMTEICDNI